jgi:Mg-chelatase subunit ChlD/tetratricopeptide (TPR) repeat protein
MNPNLPNKPREKLEARLTALLLGELSPDEAAALHRAIEKDPGLSAAYQRLKATVELVASTAADPAGQTAEPPTALKLSDERRQKLLTHFKTVAPKEFAASRQRRMSWMLTVGAAAAIALFLGLLALQNVTRSKSTLEQNASLNTLRMLDGAQQQWALNNKKSIAGGYSISGPATAPPVAVTFGGSSGHEMAGKRIEIALPTSAGNPSMAESDGDIAGRRMLDRIGGNVNAGTSLASVQPQAASEPAVNSAVGQGVYRQANTITLRQKLAEARQARERGELAASAKIYDSASQLAKKIGPGAEPEAQQAIAGLASVESRAVGTGEQKSNTGTLVQDGKVLYELGKLDEAETKLKMAVNQDPQSQGAQYYLSLLREKQFNDALQQRNATSRQSLVEVEQKWAVPPKRASLATSPQISRNGNLGASTQGTDGAKDLVPLRIELPTPAFKGTPINLAFDSSSVTTNFQAFNGAAGGLGSGGLNKPSPGDSESVSFGAMVITNAFVNRYAFITSPASSPSATAQSTSAKIDGVSQGIVIPIDATPKEELNQLKDSALGYDVRRGGVLSFSPVPPAQRMPTAPGLSATDELATSAGDAVIVADKPTPSLGDVPTVGRLFRERVQEPGKEVKAESYSANTVDYYSDASTLSTNILPPVTSEQGRAYSEAKRDLAEAQRFRQLLSMKVASEKIDLALPKTVMVEMADPAVPASESSPTLGAKLRRAFTGQTESFARVKVERDQSDISGIAGQPSPGYDPYFIQTEFEVIQSEVVLGKVIDKLHLDQSWAAKHGAAGKLTKEETLKLLKKSLDLRPVKNTSLVEIGAKSDNPQEAARIANAVAEAYKDQRLEQRLQMSRGGVAFLEARLAEQDTKVRQAQTNMDRLRKGLGIPDSVNKPGNQPQEADVPVRKPAASAPVPQPEVQSQDNPFSTFSLNVSDVSFRLAGASLEKGQMPEPNTVRTEEFINAFDYRDPEAPAGVPIAFAWDRARYPFAQNRDVLRFSLKTAAQGRQPGRPLNLVLLLDNSGSMERADRVQIIHEALRVLAAQLKPQDKFSVVTFARTPRLLVDGVAGSEAGRIAEEVSGLTPQGGTNLEEAMKLAYETALRHYLANGVNRVVLLTDGAANLGNVEPEALKQSVESHRRQGIALDCFGIGWDGYNDDLLEVLSRHGDGRYGFVNTPEEAANEFAGQLAGALHVAASDVKVQVEFNPRRVTTYRQLGYAKHQLTKEQFRDNTVDAAEIAAAEAGNALYVVEVNPGGDGPLATVRVRYKVPGTTDFHEHEWSVPYNGNASSLEAANPAMRLAATASAFAEWLVASPFAQEVTPDRLLGYLKGVPETCGADPRPKKLEWMIRQAKSLAGK